MCSILTKSFLVLENWEEMEWRSHHVSFYNIKRKHLYYINCEQMWWDAQEVRQVIIYGY